MRFHVISGILVMSSFLGPSVRGGLDAVEGDNSVWDNDSMCSVVIGRFTKPVEKENAGTGMTHSARFEPMATIAGHFDPSAYASVELQFAVNTSGVTSTITRVPPDGAIVLALIAFRDLPADRAHPVMWAVGSICPFMPEQSGLIAISGMQDSRIDLTIAKIREARSRPDPDSPEGKARARAILEKAIDDALAEEKEARQGPTTQKSK